MGQSRPTDGAEPRGRALIWAIALYALFAVITSLFAGVHGHASAWLSLAAVPAAIAVRTRPALVATCLIVGGTWLRMVYLDLPITSDQVSVTEAAASVAFTGGNPYGRGYAETIPPGAPFPYGPLALLLGPAGIWAEVAAGIATMALMAASRAWVTLAVYAALLFVVRLGTAGVNDVSSGFAITAALLALRERPLLGAALLAVAAGLKPYALAWFPAAVGLAGIRAAVVLSVGTLLAWSPIVAWGPASFLRSIELARDVHPVSQNTLNAPALRVLAAPIALASLFVRRWDLAVHAGAAIFLVVLYLDTWASLGYLLAVLPIVAIALETETVPRARRRRPR